MRIDGLLAYAEHKRDVLAAISFRDQPQDLPFSRGQMYAIADAADDGRIVKYLL